MRYRKAFPIPLALAVVASILRATPAANANQLSAPQSTQIQTAALPAAHIPQQGTEFIDVPAEHPFAVPITWLSRNNITSGYSDGTFRPKNLITREAVAAFLYRIAGKPTFRPPENSPFKDVKPSHAYYREITWLAATGVTSGYANGTFKPKSLITRETMAAFLYRASGSPDFTQPKNSPFTDVDTRDSFYKELTWMAQTGITTGYEDDTFRPKNLITREATAAFLQRSHADFGFTTERATSVFLNEFNRYRLHSGEAPLVKSECAEQVALDHARDMAQRDYFEHQDLQKVRQKCPEAGWIGENIARGHKSGTEVLQAWYASPGHRRNMLRTEFVSVGIAVAYSDAGIPYWVQVFL